MMVDLLLAVAIRGVPLLIFLTFVHLSYASHRAILPLSLILAFVMLAMTLLVEQPFVIVGAIPGGQYMGDFRGWPLPWYVHCSEEYPRCVMQSTIDDTFVPILPSLTYREGDRMSGYFPLGVAVNSAAFFFPTCTALMLSYWTQRLVRRIARRRASNTVESKTFGT
jgi:hypothetical protein